MVAEAVAKGVRPSARGHNLRTLGGCYSLPEAQMSGGVPQFRDLVAASSPEKLVVNDEERVCGHVLRERGDGGGGEGRHVGRGLATGRAGDTSPASSSVLLCARGPSPWFGGCSRPELNSDTKASRKEDAGAVPPT